MKKIFVILSLSIFVSCENIENSSNEFDVTETENLEILKNDEIVQDIDGNEYQTIKINDRIWLASNLKTTKFSNGDPIPNLLKDSDWKKAEGPGYCFFDNSKSNFKFGCLYNLQAVIDKRNICPKGWHVPTKEETIWNNKFDEKKVLNHELFNNQILGWRRNWDDWDEEDEFSTFQLETEWDDGGNSHYWLSSYYWDDNYDTEDSNDTIKRGYLMDSKSTGEYYFGNIYDGFSCRCIKDTITD